MLCTKINLLFCLLNYLWFYKHVTFYILFFIIVFQRKTKKAYREGNIIQGKAQLALKIGKNTFLS